MKTNRSRTIKNQFWLPLVAAGLTLAGYQAAAQTTIAQWTFEALPSTLSYTPGSGVSTTNYIADGGTQAGVAALTGRHTASPAFGAGTFSSPAGVGSSRALSMAGWTNNPGDYYQVLVNTTGFTNINLTFNQYSSGTGPKDFKVMYSTNGSTFTQIATYTSGNAAWVTNTVDFSSVTTLANAPAVYIRLVDNSTTSAAGGTVGSGGTSRIDNVIVAGTIAGPPQFVTPPANSTNFFGDSVNWTVSGGGDAPLSYQWYTNSFPLTPVTDGSSGYGVGTIAGSTTATLALTFVNTNQSGNYRVVVSNARGSVTSSVIRLQVNIRQPVVTNITYIRKLHDTNFVVTDTTNIYVVEGIVTTPVNLVSGPTEVESFFLQDTNGVGCDVFFRGGFTFPSQGDRVRVTAPLLQFNGLTELNPINGNPAHNVEVLSSGNALPAPQYFDFTTWPSATNLEEVLEGKYMVVSNVFIGVASNANGHFTAGGTVYLTNQFGKTFNALVPNNPVIDAVGAGLPGTFAKSIRGVISQSQTSGTVLTNGYSILLAQNADLEIGSPVTANPDAYTVIKNTAATLQPLTNDVVLSPDTNSRTLSVTAATPSAGVATIDNGTNVIFTPDLDFVGTVTINYTATDNFGNTSGSVITVTVVNPLPASPIPLTFQKVNTGLVLNWTNAAFYLQSATNVAGPYTYILGASSPYTNDVTASPMRFFRLTTQAP
ncbi:MAG: Ig-like domain-containing protein [Verrucomicrobiota bacterium]